MCRPVWWTDVNFRMFFFLLPTGLFAGILSLLLFVSLLWLCSKVMSGLSVCSFILPQLVFWSMCVSIPYSVRNLWVSQDTRKTSSWYWYIWSVQESVHKCGFSPLLTGCCFTVPSNENSQGSRAYTVGYSPDFSLCNCQYLMALCIAVVGYILNAGSACTFDVWLLVSHLKRIRAEWRRKVSTSLTNQLMFQSSKFVSQELVVEHLKMKILCLPPPQAGPLPKLRISDWKREKNCE